MTTCRFTRALLRSPSPLYASHYAPRNIFISNELALRQHDAYAAALAAAGVQVDRLPPHPVHHDCVFIEDTAVVWNGQALITRMNDLRQGEQIDVEQWLRHEGFPIHRVPESARLEGGDVLHLDKLTLVGVSARSNAEGIDSLRQFMGQHGHSVQTVAVERCLHLKSAVTYLGDRTLLVASELIDVSLPSGYERIDVPADESHAANVLRINDTILFRSGFPRTQGLLHRFAEEHRLRLHGLDISEMAKGDGALTCQSLVW